MNTELIKNNLASTVHVLDQRNLNEKQEAMKMFMVEGVHAIEYLDKQLSEQIKLSKINWGLSLKYAAGERSAKNKLAIADKELKELRKINLELKSKLQSLQDQEFNKYVNDER